MCKKRVAVYCRVAHKDQLAMERQHTQVQRFAKSEGLGPCAVYLDNGYSGMSLERPAFHKIKADIINGEIDILIAKSMCRISRHSIQCIGFLKFLEEHNVTAMFTDDPCNDWRKLVEIHDDFTKILDVWRQKQGDEASGSAQ